MPKTVPEIAPDPAPRASAARQDILCAAARMMRARGYAQVSLRDLAAEVGMKAGSLYYHFPSKEALATEVMRLGVDLVSTAVQEALAAAPGASPHDRLIIAIRAHLTMLLSASDFTSAHMRCYAFVPASVRDELTQTRKHYDRVWAQLVGAYLGQPPHSPEVRHLRHVVLGALNWSLEWYDPGRDRAEDFVATVARLLPPVHPAPPG